MCQVHNEIGCLTEIKLHLRKHGLTQFKSTNDLINFQKNYQFLKSKITQESKDQIRLEKIELDTEIVELNLIIQTKKEALNQRHLDEQDKIEKRINSLLGLTSNYISPYATFLKKLAIKSVKIVKSMISGHSDKEDITPLLHLLSLKTTRQRYITLQTEDAVRLNSSANLQALDWQKALIDDINKSIYGAFGERKVVKELKKLTDDYILINDFNCGFDSAIYYRQGDNYIKSVQIDHILVSPSGIFLIETKNWNEASIDNQSFYSPVQQIKRANFIIYKLLHERIFHHQFNWSKNHWGDRKIPIRNLIVFTNFCPAEDFEYVKILNLENLNKYITFFKPCLSKYETEQLAHYLNRIND